MLFKRTLSLAVFLTLMHFSSFSQCGSQFSWDSMESFISDEGYTTVVYKKDDGISGLYTFDFYNVLDNSLTYSKTIIDKEITVSGKIPLGTYMVKVTDLTNFCSSFIQHEYQPFLTFENGISSEMGGMIGLNPSSCEANDGSIDYSQIYYSATFDDINVEVYNAFTKEIVHSQKSYASSNKEVSYSFTLENLEAGMYFAKIYTTNPRSEHFGLTSTVSFAMVPSDMCPSLNYLNILGEVEDDELALISEQ